MKQPDSDPNQRHKNLIMIGAVAGLGAVLVSGADAAARYELGSINYSDVNPYSLNGPAPTPSMRLGEMSAPTNLPLSPVFSKLELPAVQK